MSLLNEQLAREHMNARLAEARALRRAVVLDRAQRSARRAQREARRALVLMARTF